MMKKKFYYIASEEIVPIIKSWVAKKQEVYAEWEAYAYSEWDLSMSDLVIEEGLVICNRFGETPDFELTRCPTLKDLSETLCITGILRVSPLPKFNTYLVVTEFETTGQLSPVTPDVLAAKYNVHLMAGYCPECNLMYAFDETECSRCGHKFEVKE